mmetsp:Transcript_5306/g.19049  ORF Transcript_5306/g.19049 Transcript_5306/m.19049 type:complete len:220 (-) Transcript_5306:126-785(-)
MSTLDLRVRVRVVDVPASTLSSDGVGAHDLATPISTLCATRTREASVSANKLRTSHTPTSNRYCTIAPRVRRVRQLWPQFGSRLTRARERQSSALSPETRAITQGTRPAPRHSHINAEDTAQPRNRPAASRCARGVPTPIVNRGGRARPGALTPPLSGMGVLEVPVFRDFGHERRAKHPFARSFEKCARSAWAIRAGPISSAGSRTTPPRQRRCRDSAP